MYLRAPPWSARCLIVRCCVAEGGVRDPPSTEVAPEGAPIVSPGVDAASSSPSDSALLHVEVVRLGTLTVSVSKGGGEVGDPPRWW